MYNGYIFYGNNVFLLLIQFFSALFKKYQKCRKHYVIKYPR